MPTKPTFRMDFRKFDAALKQYVRVSERAIPDIINKKAFYIARRAVVETPKAKAAKFKGDLLRQTVIAEKLLGQRIRVTKTKGIVRGRMITQKIKGAPLAALIVQARRKRHGEKGLYGSAMEEAVNQLVSARVRSAAFLKSGWIPAIKTLEKLVVDRHGMSGASGQASFRGAKQYGAAKGRAVPAQKGWNVRAIIENHASAKRDVRQALVKYGGPALQRAFDFEAKSMMDEVGRRVEAEGRKIGIKIVG